MSEQPKQWTYYAVGFVNHNDRWETVRSFHTLPEARKENLKWHKLGASSVEVQVAKVETTIVPKEEPNDRGEAGEDHHQ